MKTFEEYLAEGFSVSAHASSPAEAAEAFKQKHEANGGKIIHHSVHHMSNENREIHRVYASNAGKKTVHTFMNVNDSEQDAKYKKTGAKSTSQVRTAGKMDKPKNPNGGKLS